MEYASLLVSIINIVWQVFILGFLSLVFLFPLTVEAQNAPIKIGAATKVINNEIGSWVQGAGVLR